VVRPGDRPGRPGDRFPGIANRPSIGGGDRPWNSGTRPGSDWGSTWHGGVNNPWQSQTADWGWNDYGYQNHWNNDWHNHWQDHCVHDHYHDWYHGSWSGNWSNNWYVPAAVGATAWGLAAAPSAWGYGSEYYNPYYSTPVETASSSYYDYSQPVTVYDYGQQYSQADYSQQYVAMKPQAQAAPAVAQTAAPAPPSAEPQATDPGLEQFDAALAAFKTGDYRLAVDRCNAALRTRQKDPVIHEVRALALFAQADYKAAAATLNALLAMSPGMDWTTLSGLYGNTDDYTQQLRRLEAQCKSDPRDAAAHFVLAYHYLVTGNAKEAVDALRIVTAEQPRDATAKRMLDALAPSEQSTNIAAATTPPKPSDGGQAASPKLIPPQSSSKPEATAKATEPQTDLVGRWRAVADGNDDRIGDRRCVAVRVERNARQRHGDEAIWQVAGHERHTGAGQRITGLDGGAREANRPRRIPLRIGRWPRRCEGIEL
jgi:tetratricopeptide (TPR) repeat protein